MNSTLSYQKSINNYLLLAFSFFITTSYFAITNIIIVLFFTSWIIGPHYLKKVKFIIQTPFTLSILLFITYVLLSTIWSSESLLNDTTQKQFLIFLLPVLLTIRFSHNFLEKAKWGFILGLTCNVLLSIMTLFLPGNSFFKDGHYKDAIFAHGFIDHFDYSIFLCFGLILILQFITIYKQHRVKLILLFILFFITLLNSYGRVGMISFIIFFPIVLYHKIKIKALYIIFILLVMTLLSYYIFQPFQNRVAQTIYEINILYNGMTLDEKITKDAEYLHAQNSTYSKDYYISKIKEDVDWIKAIDNKSPQYHTSIGKRYLYIKNSMAIISNHWLFGVGAGGFSKAYLGNNSKKESNPHNNYLFIIMELGIIGLLLMLSILYIQIRTFFLNKNNILKFIFPILFLVIMLFDIYMVNPNTLAFFCLFSFIIYYEDYSLLDT